MRIFLISPVRDWDTLPREERDRITAYVQQLEDAGCTVHWPRRDTKQDGDPIGHRICSDNCQAMLIADAVHLWWSPGSEGSRFDIGEWFGMRRFLDKPFVLANPEDVEPTKDKSFANVVLYITGHINYTEDGTGWVHTV